MRKLLIANRGEIVVRVARTARAMGIATVAVYAESDEGAPHVSACDAAICIGGRTPAESYLRADAIIEAARRSGADVIHPGYGFLSENAAFARAVEAAGLIWVGPPPEAIEAMGDKARARVRMAAAGVPVTPGYHGDDQSLRRMRKEAAAIGFPVMIKASAGGGGRGMRLVSDADAFDDAFKSAASEAEKAFGDGRLILEKAIETPRHIEIQVFADAHGNVVHMGERDCSVQRRHQKIIEEAPSPAVSEPLRAEIGACAVQVAKQIGYRGAGTVEFLLDPSGAFYFMEMNTRLQVEHPVTELVTGLDLVEWQIRVARGEPLPLSQEQIQIKGWAIEARLCAEDPGADYAPRSGEIVAWRAPAHTRCDHAVTSPMSVSPFFDSMLAKVIAHGATRAEACANLRHALADTLVLGVTTNRYLLQTILETDAFVGGEHVTTAFLARTFPSRETRVVAPDDIVWTLAAWLTTLARPARERVPKEWRDWSSALASLAPWRLRNGATGADIERKGVAELGRGDARLNEGDKARTIHGVIAGPGAPFAVEIAGVRLDVVYAWQSDELWLQVMRRDDGALRVEDHVFTDLRYAPSASADAKAADAVFSPLNGRVISVDVAPGALVKRNQKVAVMEAMKMEHTLTAPRDGTVRAVSVKVGDQLRSRHKIIELEPEA